MSPARPAETGKGELRRQQLLDAAADCFRRYGFHGTSIARIREASGMSPGHIYHYFSGKEAMVEAIAERHADEMAGLLDALETDRGGGSVLDRLDRHVLRLVEHVTASPRTALMLELAAEGARNPDVRRVLQKSEQATAQRLFALLRREQAAPRLDDDELRLRIEMIAALVHGLAARSVTSPGQDRASLARLVSRSMRQLIDDGGP